MRRAGAVSGRLSFNEQLRFTGALLLFSPHRGDKVASATIGEERAT